MKLNRYKKRREGKKEAADFEPALKG